MRIYTLLLFCLFFSVGFSKTPLKLNSIHVEDLQMQHAKLAGNSNDKIIFAAKLADKQSAVAIPVTYHIEAYLGDQAYLLSANYTNINAKQLSTDFVELYQIDNSSKIDVNIDRTKKSIPVTILFSSYLLPTDISALANSLGFTIEQTDFIHHHFSAYLSPEQIQKLTEKTDIFYITKYFPQKNTLLFDNACIIGQSQINGPIPFGFNLDGSGNNIGIWDEGTVGQNFELPASKNINIDKALNFPPFTTHPTFVGGCIASQGNNFFTVTATSPKSVNFYYDILNDIVNEILSAKTEHQVNISNHSYNFSQTSCYESGSYIPDAADLDKIVNDNPELLPVIAVGNSASLCAASDTFHSIDIGFQGCKNVITVGWLFADKKNVGNSGRGPVDDGRLKPELVAKGFAVSTTAPGNGFSTGWGSSFAAPFVAGCASVLYQKYKQQYGVFPHGALVKAILCNTAKDLGNAGPDYTYGFGHPDILKAVQSVANNQFFESQVAQNETKIFNVVIPPNLKEFKATLCWTDKEGSPLASKYLVNNLDLKLVSPFGEITLPWVLDPNHPRAAAGRGVDNLNSIEFVSLQNPSAGTYKLMVTGTNVPFGPQDFSITYFDQQKPMEITFPNGGEVLDVRTAYNIRWNANSVDSVAAVEYSSDNGATWNLISAAVTAKNELISWTTPNNAVSNQYLIRITSGNNVAISAAPFTVGGQLDYNTIQSSVCDGTAKITWSPQTGATGYKVYYFDNEKWNLAGQTATTNFTIANLTNGKLYLYAVSTILNGIEGNHSLAKYFTPTATACATVNDVGVYEVVSKLGGRRFTSTALGTTEKMVLIVKNYGTATQNTVTVKYTINGGPVRTATLSQSMPSNDTAILSFTTNEDFSVIGNYQFKAWTQLAGDENLLNDTLYYTIKNLANNPLTLPFYDSYETSNTEYVKSIFGIDGLDYTDFYKETNARWRSDESNLTANTGMHAITLDNIGNTTAQKSTWIQTYNLSNYADSVVFLDFDFMNRAEKDGGDKLFARGNDMQPWVEIYDFFANRGDSGVYHQVEGINLYQKLKIENSQSFSSSTQLKFEVSTKNAATSPYGSGGYTFDDLHLYTVGKDIAVLDASVKAMQCISNAAAQPITVTLKNNSGQNVTNLDVYYQINTATPVHEVISTPINNNQTSAYTFTTLFNESTPGNYTIKIWVAHTGDKFKNNDSITISTKLLASVSAFPYYTGFEDNDGNLLVEGSNSSWVWGTPQKYYMNDAAEDNKAWTTGLNKGYNYAENSRLYLGCFDFSSLISDPLIAFHYFTAIQQQSDSAFMEYSDNGGSTWKRLGCNGCGLNWYDEPHHKPYWENTLYPWQTAHITLPLNTLQDSNNVLIRLQFLSDDYYTTEGIGLDDLHILPSYQTIAGEDSTYINNTSNGSGWVSFYKNGDIIAEVYDDGNALGNIRLGYEANPMKHKYFQRKNILPRNWVFKPQNNVSGNFKLRFYLKNNEYVNFVLSEDSINRMGDIGMLRYMGLNTDLDVTDNHILNYYKYFSPQEVHFFPYNGGYYVEITTDTLGEFYLISSREDADAVPNVNIISFDAEPLNNDVYIEWNTNGEINSQYFIIQYSFDGVNFINIDTVPAGVSSSVNVLYNYIHELNTTGGTFYYRVVGVDMQFNKYYSLIDSVYFAPVTAVKNMSNSLHVYADEQDVFLQLKNLSLEQAKVVIYNDKGQVLYKQLKDFNRGTQALQIPQYDSWSPAVYFIQIQSDDKQYYAKFVKK